MTTTKDRPAGTGAVRTSTVTEHRPAVRAADEAAQCRMLRSDGSRCPHTALPCEPGEIVICAKHAARVLALVNQHQAATRTRRIA